MSDAPYGLIVTRAAARAIAESLPESVAAAVIEFMTGPLIENPQRVGVALRSGEIAGMWSARRGTYRILYRIDNLNTRVEVIRVGHRRDVYRLG